jgi:serine/threonine protein kinase
MSAGGDLFYHMSARMEQGKWGFEESECKVLLAEVTLGLEHLHDHGFIHRDLKVREKRGEESRSRLCLLSLSLSLSPISFSMGGQHQVLLWRGSY